RPRLAIVLAARRRWRTAAHGHWTQRPHGPATARRDRAARVGATHGRPSGAAPAPKEGSQAAGADQGELSLLRVGDGADVVEEKEVDAILRVLLVVSDLDGLLQNALQLLGRQAGKPGQLLEDRVLDELRLLLVVGVAADLDDPALLGYHLLARLVQLL